MEVICINSSFPADALAFYKQTGTITPTVDKIYNIREVIKTVTGQTGILLEELRNPVVTFPHPILGQGKKEVNWNLNRFAKLSGEPINSEEIKELLKIKLTT